MESRKILLKFEIGQKKKLDKEKDFVHVYLHDWIIVDENHDLAIARSSSSHADPGLTVAFKCLNV